MANTSLRASSVAAYSYRLSWTGIPPHPLAYLLCVVASVLLNNRLESLKQIIRPVCKEYLVCMGWGVACQGHTKIPVLFKQTLQTPDLKVFLSSMILSHMMYFFGDFIMCLNFYFLINIIIFNYVCQAVLQECSCL